MFETLAFLLNPPVDSIPLHSLLIKNEKTFEGNLAYLEKEFSEFKEKAKKNILFNKSDVGLAIGITGIMG
tara:strand:+ start:39 stop:248 length:210 start_codon:yes stop_codon:yes gene_type:complete